VRKKKGGGNTGQWKTVQNIGQGVKKRGEKRSIQLPSNFENPEDQTEFELGIR